MTFIRNDKTDFAKHHNDVFGQLRTTSSTALFDASFRYGVEENQFFDTVVGGGSTAHSTTRASWTLDVGTASGDKVTRETSRIRYNIGSINSSGISAILGAPKTDVEQRLGVFDDNNGAFFVQTGSGVGIVTRSSGTGSVVDTFTPQASWNVDPLDGTGPSGLSFDPTNVQLYFVEYNWAGAATIRFGIYVSDRVIYVHEQISGTTNTPTFTNADLPIRVEIENLAATGSASSMEIFAASNKREDGTDVAPRIVRSVIRSETTALTIPTTGFVPVGAIRLRSTLNGVPVTGSAVVTSVPLLNQSSNDIIIRVVANPTTLTGASFNPLSTNSLTEVDFSATAFSGGDVLFNSFFGGGSGGGGASLAGNASEQDILLLPGITRVLAARAIGTDADILAAVNVIERY